MEKAVIILHGRVQGVFFRHSARVRAGALGIRGIAENQTDGSLIIIAEGEKAKIEELTANVLRRIEHVEQSARPGDRDTLITV